MSTIIALLRGINVGGKAAIRMAELKASFEALGFEDVVTYINSGNVVFRGSNPDAAAIEKRIEKDFGLTVSVMLRTPKELAAIEESNPFPRAEPARLHVVFLSGRPTARAVAGLDPDRSPPDEFRVVGREIYLHTPGGIGRSKLAGDYFERTLGVQATTRNWNTVTKLLALAAD
jgi:uncharacterized protein (DUF1697 family)